MENPDTNLNAPNSGSEAPQNYIRFNIAQRIEHLIFLLSFTLLGITGLPQRYPDSSLFNFILQVFGGIETARQIHHISAFVMMIVSGYHIIAVLYKVFVLRIDLSILPLIEDFKHLFHDIAYYLGMRKHKAYYGRYNYAEKVEYLAVVWGTIVMGLTGFMMWNPITTAKYLPGEAIPAAKAAHSGEAVLAILAIIVWHFYHVHLRHLNLSMFTGKLTRREMEHEHPAELALIESKKGWQPPNKDVIQERRRIFVPVAVVLTAVFAVGIVGFITIEDSALTTIPHGETVEIYAPITPTPRPTPHPTPTQALAAGVTQDSWTGTYQAMFRNRCGTCHGTTAVGGLSLASYQEALAGGSQGSGIVPGDPDASMIVQVQATGSHPGQLTIDELNQVIEWIKNGAPEN